MHKPLLFLSAALVLTALGACSTQEKSAPSELEALANQPGRNEIPPQTKSTTHLSALGANALPKAAAATAPPSTGGAIRLTIPPGRYADTFELAKHALRDLGFLIDRVDAQSGVLTTQPKASAGIATPWDSVQTDLDQEFEDLFERQTRIVRIDFVPEASQTAETAEPAIVPDLRRFDGPVQAHVYVTISRVHTPGWRLNTKAITYSTYAQNLEMNARGLYSYTVPIKRDDRLEERIAERLRESLASTKTADAH